MTPPAERARQLFAQFVDMAGDDETCIQFLAQALTDQIEACAGEVENQKHQYPDSIWLMGNVMYKRLNDKFDELAAALRRMKE